MKIRNLVFILFFSLFLLLPLSGSGELNALLLEGLSDMPLSLLNEKGTFLGLETYGTREDILSRIFTHYGYTPTDEVTVTESVEASITLEHSHYYFMDQSNHSVILSGGVKLTGETWHLSADIIFYDTQSEKVTAVGSVSFVQEELDVTGEVLTFDIVENDIRINRGSTQIERSSADDDPLTLLSSGLSMRITSNPSTYSAFDTSITSSVEHSYYTIDASDALFVEGNDVFIKNVTLKMGRVPILYLPVFYYPGKTLTFNPLFGYDSVKGSFVTLTYELYGSNPLKDAKSSDEKGTFTTFFADERELSREEGSLTYEYVSEEQETSLQKWARESSSYFSIYGDAYENEGIHLGIDTHNVYGEKVLTADLAGGIALVPPSFNTAGIPDTRYYIEPEIDLKVGTLDLSFSFPSYSDTQVKEDYLVKERFGNYFNSFFSDESSLTGDSQVTSYSWEAKGSYTLKPSFFSPFIQEIKLSNIESSVSFIRNYDTSIGGFIIDSEQPLSYSASMRGELFSFSFTKKGSEQQQAVSYDKAIIDELNRFEREPVRYEGKAAGSDAHTFKSSLTYTVSQSGDYTTEYVKGVKDDENSRATNKAVFNLTESYLPDFFSGKHTLESNYSDTAEAAERSRQYSLVYSHSVSIPAIALTHTYKQTFYDWESFTATDGTVTEDELKASFTESSVLTHTIALAPRFTFGTLALTPSVTYRLPPFDGLITASVTARQNKLSFLSSLTFEDNGGNYTFTNTKFSATYSGEIFTTSHTLNTVPDGLSILDSYTVSSSASLSFDFLDMTVKGSSLWDGDVNAFEKVNGELSTKYAGAKITYEDDGTYLTPSTGQISISTGDLNISLWHDRINAGVNIHGEYHHSFYDTAGSYLLFSLNFTFDIYKFLSIEIDLSSQNKGLDRYSTWDDVVSDFLDSFDFFGTGRYTTQFVMNSLGISIVHKMDDWDLVGTYTGKVTYSNSRYEWTPVVSIYLKWKAIPEINIDRELEL